MYSYLLKFITLAIFSSVGVFSYYKLYPFHVEKFTSNAFYYYLIPLFLIYGVYKLLSLFVFNDESSEKITFSYKSLITYSLIHLLLLCIVYFISKDGFSGSTGITLFFKILWFLILPFTILISSYGFGNKVLSYIKGFEKEEDSFKFLTSFGFGFFSFIALVFLGANFYLYNLYYILFIIVLFLGLGFKNILKFFTSFFTKEIEIDKGISLYTSEFLFVVITALISTNLILVFRPFPIGWDDLGSYMNNPNLLAYTGHMVALGGMQAWELFTGIGYLFGSPTQAFYLNTFSGILASIVIYIFTKSFLKEKNEFVNIPLLLVAIFLSIPMVIFQLGKDMKLDIGLLSISLIGIYIFYYIFIKKEEFIGDKEEKSKVIPFLSNYFFKKEFFKKEDYYYIFIAGIIVGFAFAIKFTTLMLISGILGLIIFNRLGFIAFCGFLSLYFGFFTKLHLWDMMNVVYPKDNLIFINTFFYISTIVGFICLYISYIRHNNDYFKKTFLIIVIFFSGVILALSPRLTKNIIESGGKISVGVLLGGVPDTLKIDYTKLYSTEEIKVIEKKIESRAKIDSEGQSSDADFGRYFGYEKGLNNYLKLPYNLTVQSNQRGEYTDITYIFFALIPALFLFIPYRRNWYSGFIYGALIFETLYFILPNTSSFISNFFSGISMPFGYIIILSLFLGGLFFFKNTTNWKNDNVLKLLLVNFSFFSFYVFLWNIAAYGIVWYGITMYMSFLLFIGIGIYYVVKENKELDLNPNFYLLKALNFFFIFTIISIYFVKSSLPHMFANFSEDSYQHYKSGQVTQEESVFMYHAEYLTELFELNIKDEKKGEFISKYKKNLFEFISNYGFNDQIKNVITQINDIKTLNDVMGFLARNDELAKVLDVNKLQIMRNFVNNQRYEMYTEISYPSKEYKSNALIYRMGTFLKYFISENNSRMLEDSLLYSFNDYISADNINKTIENMKKIGLNYILVDLNTPTIDKDPRHELTTRFEKLLTVFSSDKVQLLSTDSLCLRTGLELYSKSEKSEKDLNNYVKLIGVNFESYTNGKEINRGEKLVACYETMIYLINNGFIKDGDFTYLSQIKDDFLEQKFADDNAKYQFFLQKVPAGYKALFKIK